VRRGDVIKAQIPHQIPTQSQGLFMNSRRPTFSDARCAKRWG
jgi:microcin C transport system substrate-binding protein